MARPPVGVKTESAVAAGRVSPFQVRNGAQSRRFAHEWSDGPASRVGYVPINATNASMSSKLTAPSPLASAFSQLHAGYSASYAS